jgi:hypothetical protein
LLQKNSPYLTRWQNWKHSNFTLPGANKWAMRHLKNYKDKNLTKGYWPDTESGGEGGSKIYSDYLAKYQLITK